VQDRAVIQQYDGVVHDEIVPCNHHSSQRIISQQQLPLQMPNETLRRISQLSKGTTTKFQDHLLYRAPCKIEFSCPMTTSNVSSEVPSHLELCYWKYHSAIPYKNLGIGSLKCGLFSLSNYQTCL